MSTDRDWDVLLIGGGGAVGKTHVASRIGARFSASTMQADDVRLVLQRAIPATTNPGLHFFVAADIRNLDLADSIPRQLEIGRFVSEMLEIAIAHHVSTAQRLVIEGDAILPDLATQKRHAGISTKGRVRAVFIEEKDLDRVYAAQRERGRGSDLDQRRWAAFHHEHGRVLADRARTLGVPVVPARPRHNLAARIRDAAGI